MKRIFIKMVKKILNIFSNIFYNTTLVTINLTRFFFQRYLVFSTLTPITKKKDEIIWKLIKIEDLNQEFVYKDETWNPVRFLNSYLFLNFHYLNEIPEYDNICINNRAIISENSIDIKVDKGIPNRWVIFYLRKSLGAIYAFECEISILSEFTEIQFGFNYESIAKRLRFMIVDNKKLVFEVVDRGWFFNPNKSLPLSLNLGQKYKIRIEIVLNSYYFYLDNSLKMSVCLNNYQANDYNNFLIIMFENESKRDIRTKIDSISFYKQVND